MILALLRQRLIILTSTFLFIRVDVTDPGAQNLLRLIGALTPRKFI